jgi:hypothetical protein
VEFQQVGSIERGETHHRSAMWRAWCDKFDTTGKSLPIFRNHVKPRNEKYFAFPEMKIMALVASSLPTRGAFRDRHDALGLRMRWTPWRQAFFGAGRKR